MTDFNIGDKVRFTSGKHPMIVKGIRGDKISAMYENKKSHLHGWFTSDRFVHLLDVGPAITPNFKVGDVVRTKHGGTDLRIMSINPNGKIVLKYIETGAYRYDMKLVDLVPVKLTGSVITKPTSTALTVKIKTPGESTFTVFSATDVTGAIWGFLGKTNWDIKPGDVLQDTAGVTWFVLPHSGSSTNLRLFAGAKMIPQALV